MAVTVAHIFEKPDQFKNRRAAIIDVAFDNDGFSSDSDDSDEADDERRHIEVHRIQSDLEILKDGM